MYLRRFKVLLASAILLGGSACATETDTTNTPAAHDTAETEASDATETATAQPRLAVTYDGGVMVVDAVSGEVVLDEAMEGFLRVSPAGDDRHVMVAGSGGWRAIDLGTWGHSHGEHDHHYAGDTALTDIEFTAVAPGHVVHHDGHTTLWDDGTGTMTTFDPHSLAEGQPDVTTLVADKAHHGVAIVVDGRNTLHTVGTEDKRSGIRLAGPTGDILAETEDCPGVHGEAAAERAVVFGCEDGVVVVEGREITKIPSPNEYGRIGNQAGSALSPVVLGDYKSDPEAELERPTRVSLIDTEKHTLRLVDLGTSYSFRSLGRGPEGEALVLGYDGKIHVIDPAKGRVTDSIPVVKPWREPKDWQQPRPTLTVTQGAAYVSEPTADAVHVVDLSSGRVTSTVALPHTPNEITANIG